MSDAGDRVRIEDIRVGLTREELLRRAAVGGAALLAAGRLPELADAAPIATPKRGGTFRVGVPGGSSKDLIDGQHIVTEPDIARNVATFEGLSYFDDTYNPKIDGLAEELRAEKPNQWLIRVRDGVEFHNGKTLTADDVIYSLRRTTNAKLGLFGHAGFASIDPNRIRKLDKRTVRLFLKRPDVNLIDAFSQYFQGIVPVGYSPNAIGKGPLRFVGTGAFKVKSFVPGRQSVHVRNPNYWRSGQPHFDQVVIIDFPDEAAAVNALLGGQVDAIKNVPFAQVGVIKRRSNLKLYNMPSGAWDPITMAVDQKPFTDVRVRQAFRLMANRPQMVVQGIGGYGRIANDVYSPSDACYAGDEFPQRHQDIDRAKFLLKQAGQSNLSIEIFTTNGDAGMIEVAQVFAQNAKSAGVSVKVRNDPNFYGPQYLKYTFAVDFWGTRNFLSQVAVGSLPDSTYNETHWKDPTFIKLYKQALATVDRKKRCQIIKDMQRIEYDRGGHIIPWFKNQLAAYNNKVGGFKRDVGTLALNKYGNNFRTIYFV